MGLPSRVHQPMTSMIVFFDSTSKTMPRWILVQYVTSQSQLQLASNQNQMLPGSFGSFGLIT